MILARMHVKNPGITPPDDQGFGKGVIPWILMMYILAKIIKKSSKKQTTTFDTIPGTSKDFSVWKTDRPAGPAFAKGKVVLVPWMVSISGPFILNDFLMILARMYIKIQGITPPWWPRVRKGGDPLDFDDVHSCKNHHKINRNKNDHFFDTIPGSSKDFSVWKTGRPAGPAFAIAKGKVVLVPGIVSKSCPLFFLVISWWFLQECTSKTRGSPPLMTKGSEGGWSPGFWWCTFLHESSKNHQEN